MTFIDEQLIIFKKKIESSIRASGSKGKESTIRSSTLINLIHDSVKFELQQQGVNANNIYPHFKNTKPEIKIAGFLKQKDQDICVIPSRIKKTPNTINWGPMAFQSTLDPYGYNFSTHTLIINVRSQMSSIAKNTDTLLERTFAEALNLHLRYPDIVLGEVYLIPTHEYDDSSIANRQITFKTQHTDIEKYISFFNAINNRSVGDDAYKYERCALLVVDFRSDTPYLFKNSDELKKVGLISRDFQIEYATLCFDTFAKDLLSIYDERFDIQDLFL